mmetsp:Transcript_134881/g.238624  ORF Transcript_134881/g.238624 Transcript_134881/m.238624 type:complete len:517 (+) Transcript_134881:88-1638(+)
MSSVPCKSAMWAFMPIFFQLMIISHAAAPSGSFTVEETCHASSCRSAAREAETEAAPLSEDDVASAEDSDVDAVRFSLMQKASPQLVQTLSNTEAESPLEYPYDAMSCGSKQAMQTKKMSFDDYDEVVSSVRGLYKHLPTTCNSSYCPQSDWTGCVLRLAAHDFMDKQGADGCVYLPDKDNNGLRDCLYQGSHGQELDSAYKNFCSWLSLADFIVIAAEAVMNITRNNVLVEVDSTRQPFDFRSNFKYGRETKTKCPTANGEMPSAERGCDAVDDSLLKRIGLNWTQAAALMGGHTIGEARLDRSGYNGRWKEARASRRFDNGYFTSMLYKGWGPDLKVWGNNDRNQWARVDLGADILMVGREMMLDSDMCLYFSSMDTEVPARPLHANLVKDRASGCDCAWVRNVDKHAPAINKYMQGKMCGLDNLFPANAESLTNHRGLPTLNSWNFTKQRAVCCSMQHVDTYAIETDCKPFGPAAGDVMKFAMEEEPWVETYEEAWKIATTRGHPKLVALKGD